MKPMALLSAIFLFGQNHSAPVKINGDIKNISGATLSCMHVTEDVRRMLFTHALVLKKL